MLPEATEPTCESLTAGELPNGHTPASSRGHVVRRGTRDMHVERHHPGRQGLHVSSKLPNCQQNLSMLAPSLPTCMA